MKIAEIERKQIDKVRTGRQLQVLRLDNENLRRYVCSALNYDKNECDGNCEDCDPRYTRRGHGMDLSISQRELAQVFGVGTSVVATSERAEAPDGRLRHANVFYFLRESCKTDGQSCKKGRRLSATAAHAPR